MKLSEMGMKRLLRISSVLVILGLVLEIFSLLWFHPLSFVFFAFVAGSLTGAGILVYLISLLFLTAAPGGPRNPSGS